MRNTVYAIAMVLVLALGVYGIKEHIEYSGWLIFIGGMMAAAL